MSAAPQKYPAMPVTPSGPAAAWLRPIGDQMSNDFCMSKKNGGPNCLVQCLGCSMFPERWMPFAAGPIPGRGQILVTDGSAVYNMDCADIAAFQEVGDKLTHWARMIEPFPPQSRSQSEE